MFLLVPAYPGSHGEKAVKRLCVCVCVVTEAHACMNYTRTSLMYGCYLKLFMF